MVPRSGGDKEDAKEEAGVADAIDDEGFFARIGSGLLEEIETDQQVTAEPHAFPTHKEEQQIVGEDQREHGEHEEVQVAEEAVVATFMIHVADGIDVDEEADAGHDQNHHAGERVKEKAPVGDEESRDAIGWERVRRDTHWKRILLEDAMAGSSANKATAAPAA